MNPAIVHPQLAKASFGRAIQPLLTGARNYELLGIKLLNFSYPYLDVEIDWRVRGAPVRLRVDGTDFPYRPISGWWIDNDGQKLQAGSGRVPEGYGFHTSNQYGGPGCWFCFRGWREYHDHTSHQDTSWASIRDDKRYSVLQLILQLHKDLNQTGVTVR